MSRPLDSLLALAERTVTVADLVGSRPLWCVEPDRPATEAAAEMRDLHYDVAPLHEEPVRRYIVATEAETATGTASDVARTIDAGLLVSSSLPLADAVADLGFRPFLFVLERDRITHILTEADLQLPPVSLVALGFITAAEAALDLLIERRLGTSWITQITVPRRRQIEAVFAQRRRHNAEITPLQCSNLDDRLAIAAKVEAIWRATGSPSRKRFQARASSIKRLRDTLAHGGGLLDAEPEPERAVSLFADVRVFAEATWAEVERDDALFDAFASTSIRLTEPEVVLAVSGAVAELPLAAPMHTTGVIRRRRPRPHKPAMPSVQDWKDKT